ncbi:ScyD/ScyE family protein [Deinococcus sp.]|uniref:ScyD/ScyE family protein n=1 Tax=Deinococcus sp. TaxID=47478 RepID=UPI002869A5D9|nr:ScyD/ScyE family protein [Deinococcus sp.]
MSGLKGAQGSSIGPGHALYVTEPSDGRIVRIDPDTGAVTTFASGLPAAIPEIGVGGVMDVEFIGHTAYALVTLVGPDVGGHNAVGIYRIDSPTTSTLIADIGAFSLAHPPIPAFFVPTGVQYALQRYEGGFLVTDGHHNRVLRVTLDGRVSELIAFDDIVPTGLAVAGRTVYVAEAGPIPHLPQNGKVVAFRPGSQTAINVAAGARLLVDVEFGRGRTLFALAQGFWAGKDGDEGTPAQPNTGSLVRAERDGTFTVVAGPLDRPTSMEIIGNTAYVVTLGGEVWTVDHIAGPPHGDHSSDD